MVTPFFDKKAPGCRRIAKVSPCLRGPDHRKRHHGRVFRFERNRKNGKSEARSFRADGKDKLYNCVVAFFIGVFNGGICLVVFCLVALSVAICLVAKKLSNTKI